MTTTTEQIKITAPNMRQAAFHIKGTAPLMIARFSKKAELMYGMEEGNTQSKKKERKGRNYQQEMESATYYTTEGWNGMNAAAFRNAAISACKLVGFKMTHAKLSIFVEADGFDKEEGVPLVKIIKGTPQMSSMPARNANNSVDIRVRPLWLAGWEAIVRMRWDADQFSLTDVTNLMVRVGSQVGIGEGRPDSRSSAGLGYGLFEIVQVAELR